MSLMGPQHLTLFWKDMAEGVIHSDRPLRARHNLVSCCSTMLPDLLKGVRACLVKRSGALCLTQPHS